MSAHPGLDLEAMARWFDDAAASQAEVKRLSAINAELLEALKALHAWSVITEARITQEFGEGPVPDEISQADAAIAKAEGRS